MRAPSSPRVGSAGASAATPSRSSVSAIVPTYQRHHALKRVVQALLDDVTLDELVVAVDGSTDGTLEWLRERRKGDERLTVADRPNGGIAAARQTGLEAASGDIVLFVDDDVMPTPGLVDRHRRHHAGAPFMVVKGYTPNRWSHLPRGRRAIGRIYREAYDATCDRYEREPDHVLLGFWGGNFSLRRQDALMVGMAPSRLISLRRQEDREFGIRCHRAGLLGRFDRSLIAEHLYDRTLEEFRRDCRGSGWSRCLIHDLHPDVVGQELLATTGTANTLDLPGRSLPRPLEAVWPRLADDPLFRPITILLEAGFRFGKAVGIPHIEMLTGRALGSIETQRGVLEYSS